MIAVAAALVSLVLLAPFGATSPAGATRLQITVWPQGYESSSVVRYKLSCGPATGNVPRPGRACTALSRMGAKAFAPTAPDSVCTTIWGGPAKARVRGVVGGVALDARLSLVNGCEIARWDKVAAVVPRPRS